MEENKDIFLGSGDALLYLTGPVYKKYFTKFFWCYPFNTYLMTDFSTLPLPVHICAN